MHPRVKGHRGIRGNEEADRLSKGLGLHTRTRGRGGGHTSWPKSMEEMREGRGEGRRRREEGEGEGEERGHCRAISAHAQRKNHSASGFIVS